MVKIKKSKKQEKLPKVAELVSALASFMDSGTDYGADYGMTRLSKEIELKNSNPHVDTVRNKLTEHFLMRDALKDWMPVWNNGRLIRVRKAEPKEINMERILDALLKINEKLDKK